ncbi:MAG TPA: Bax inhibitor-1/YccA family protein [Acidobacteriaceae bacterium]|nr:Bax inhibitor-1/YccA family protein [Acidobacteriaceae bacterium]
MALIKTSNPALGKDTFNDFANTALDDATHAGHMTLSGTVNKTGVLLVCTMATAAWTWHQFTRTRQFDDVAALVLTGVLMGFVVAMITIFKKDWSPITAPIYAALEGLALGGLSAVTEMHYPGIGIQAVSLTFGTLFVLLFLYRTGVIKVTEKLRLGIIAATGGIAAFYLIEIVMGLFGSGVHFAAINGSGALGIGFSVVVVGVAALNLVLDFDFIEQGIAVGAPKYMEWYGAFGIMVTLIWLYLEILRLLSKARSRN